MTNKTTFVEIYNRNIPTIIILKHKKHIFFKKFKFRHNSLHLRDKNTDNKCAWNY